MDSTSFLAYLASFIIAIVFLSRMAKSFMQTGLVIMVVLFIYMLVSNDRPSDVFYPGVEQVFEKHDLVDLQQRHCVNERDAVVCECIVEPVAKDMFNRFSNGKLDRLQASDREAFHRETLKSYHRKSQVIDKCLREKDKGKVRIVESLRVLYQGVDDAKNTLSGKE
ncbi:MAG: hypothetical protein IPL35_12485 [Sphingobacteriales bacterium]|nr:hypothetical protein [Sphingobacteriales bacterium]